VFLQAEEGIFEAGAVVHQPLALIRFTLDPAFTDGDRELALIASFVLFEPRVRSANHTALAQGLDSLVASDPRGELASDLLHLHQMDDAALAESLDKMDPTPLTAMPEASRHSSAGFADRVAARMDSQRWGAASPAPFGQSARAFGSGGLSLASAGDNPAALAAAIGRRPERVCPGFWHRGQPRRHFDGAGLPRPPCWGARWPGLATRAMAPGRERRGR
jgi:hypothetical protein